VNHAILFFNTSLLSFHGDRISPLFCPIDVIGDCYGSPDYPEEIIRSHTP
jgi:hypothetical protein